LENSQLRQPPFWLFIGNSYQTIKLKAQSLVIILVLGLLPQTAG